MQLIEKPKAEHASLSELITVHLSGCLKLKSRLKDEHVFKLLLAETNIMEPKRRLFPSYFPFKKALLGVPIPFFTALLRLPIPFLRPV